MSNQRYMMRGVSASKEDVHNAIKNIDKGIFPQAFCKIIPDILGGDPEYCNIMHADGAGTKSSLAYMYWKETGDLGVWKGIAQDALIMNIGTFHAACYGQATYEKEYNGGMGSNGLTSARHDVFAKYLAEKYPESYDKAVPEELVYSGNLKLTDAVEGSPLDAGKLVLSPTRTYAPVVNHSVNFRSERIQ